MLHWANRIITEGRGKGVTVLSASQRPQKVHKDFVTSNETLIAMRVIHPLDRNAIKEWIDGCPDREKGREVLESLASMKRGEGWVWSPEIGFGPQHIAFPMFETFDSFAAPKTEADRHPKGWADVDLDDVRKRLAKSIEQAKRDDPKLLRARVAELERELAKERRAVASLEALKHREPERIEVPVLKPTNTRASATPPANDPRETLLALIRQYPFIRSYGDRIYGCEPLLMMHAEVFEALHPKVCELMEVEHTGWVHTPHSP